MFLEKLSNLPGVSGDEGAVREAIIEILQGHPQLEWRTDTTGNLLVRKNGSSSPSRRVMLAAHMDEVGLIIVSIEKSGHLKFKSVGGIDSRVLVSKRVRVGREGIPGVIGVKAIHLQKPDERKKPFKEDQLYIDIGAKNIEEAEKHVSIGSYAAFDTECLSFGEGCFRGKAFDDRAGCAVLLELLREKNSLSFDAAFTVQEEVGLRGARVASYTLRPQLALAVEATAAADTPDTKKEQSAAVLGKGPALSFMDRTLIVDRGILQSLIEAGERTQVPFQFRRATAGGTDAGAIALSREGVKAGVVAVPCRYIHSPCSVLKESDLQDTVSLVRAWLEAIA
ncbi:MAG: M42 family peptidase [Dethiobacteria bacterium]|jgi:endoglucanase